MEEAELFNVWVTQVTLVLKAWRGHVWREAEAWHCVAGLEFLKRAQEKLLMKPSCNRGRPKFWRCLCQVMASSSSNCTERSQLEHSRQVVCGEVAQSPGGAQRIMGESQMFISELLAVLGLGLSLSRVWLYPVASLLKLKALNLFFWCKGHSWEILNSF